MVDQRVPVMRLLMGSPMRASFARMVRWLLLVVAYTKPRQGYKADPPSKVRLCLGKSELQDAWVIGDGSRVFLSRSIRRVEDSWTNYVACFQNFTAFPSSRQILLAALCLQRDGQASPMFLCSSCLSKIQMFLQAARMHKKLLPLCVPMQASWKRDE